MTFKHTLVHKNMLHRTEKRKPTGCTVHCSNECTLRLCTT